MAGFKGKCCKKKFLYEVETPGLIYLSLDGRNPVYVGFQHKLKLEICLVSPEGQLQTTLSSGKLEVKDQATLNHTEESAWADNLVSAHSYPKETEMPIKFMSSTEGNDGSDQTEMEHVPFIGHKTDDMFNQLHKTDKSYSKFNSPITNTQTVAKLKSKPLAKQQSEKELQMLRIGVREKFIRRKEKNEKERQKARVKLLMSKAIQNRESMILSKKQLDIFLEKSNKKSSVVNDESQRKADSCPLSDQYEDREGRRINLEVLQRASTSNDKQSEDNLVLCSCCAQFFPSKKEYERHIKSMPKKYHVCLKCNTAFPFKAYLWVHRMYHNDEVPRSSYKCNKCAFESPNLNKLKKHMLNHTRELRFQCCQCDKMFTTHSALLNHMPQHRPKGHYKCSCCDELFSSRSALAEHRKNTVPPKCGLCGQIFPNNTSRYIHYTTDHKDTILKCPTCGRMYSTQYDLTRHMFIHNRLKKQCPVCGIMVNRLEDHMLTHASVDEIPDSKLFMCDQCPRKFKFYSRLKSHQESHAKSRPKFSCHLCSQACASSAGLSRHMKNVHSDLMPYQCEICGKLCKQKSNLRVHMRIHYNTKMFPCNFCDQAFNYKASLQGHLRSKHSLEVTAGSDFVSSVNNLVLSESASKTDNSCIGTNNTDGLVSKSEDLISSVQHSPSCTMEA